MKNPSLTKIIKLAENGHYHYTGNECRLVENLKQLQRKHTEQIESLVSKLVSLENQNRELAIAISRQGDKTPYKIRQQKTESSKKMKLTVSPSSREIRVKFSDVNSDDVRKDVMEFIQNELLDFLNQSPAYSTVRGYIRWRNSLQKYETILQYSNKETYKRFEF